MFDTNGLWMWNEEQILLRNQAVDRIYLSLRKTLLGINNAWKFHRIDAPILTPRHFISPNYTDEDVWVLKNPASAGEMVLRPETTPSSYAYMTHLLTTHSGAMPPFCVWQAGKSFRFEQDQPSKFIRLKEFYQLEFQCAYAVDTKADYRTPVIEAVRATLASITNLPATTIPSDRLPKYSRETTDVEVPFQDRQLELCSISTRTDFATTFREKQLDVLEVAVGLDRVVTVQTEMVDV